MRVVLFFVLGCLVFCQCKPDHSESNVFIDYFDNGKKKSEGEILKNGTRVGCWKYYYDNGLLMTTGCYVEGLKKGNWIYYDSSNKVGDSINWSIYKSKDSTYKVNYPSNWELVYSDKQPNAVGVFNYSKGKPFYDNFNVTQQTYASDFNLAKEVESMMGKFGDSLEVINSMKAEINGKESILVYFAMSQGETRLKVFQASVKSGNKLYLISCFSDASDFSEYQDLFNEVVFSFSAR